MPKPEEKQDSKRVFADVKARASLADYIEYKCGTTAKRVGSSIFFNPSPCCAHNDCFSLFGEDHSAYKCHSCGEGGDVFSFVQAREGVGAGEALQLVALWAGVTLPKLSRDDAAPPNALQRVLEATVAHYRAVLARSPHLLTYLKTPKPDGRGHVDATIEAMEMGASDGQLLEALTGQGFSIDEVKAAGLYVESKKNPGEWRDYFVPGLIIYPHRLPSGEVAHFTLKDPRKKLDYQFRAEHRLDGFVFGNQRAINAETVIVCEGENDLASFFDAGFRNVLATLGSLSDAQIQWIENHSNSKRFVLWFDFDTKPGANGQAPAGTRYTRKLYQRLLRNRTAQVVVASALMEPGEDPDDWIQKDREGAGKRIQAALKKAHNPLLWELRVLPADVRADADAALRTLEEMEFFEYLGLLPELARDAVIVELQKLGFSRDSVLNSIKSGYSLRDQLVKLLDAYNGSTRSDGYRMSVGNAVWNYFRERGKFFVSGDKLHLFYHQKIYSIGDNTPFKALMHREAGINYKQDVAPFVWEELKALCYTRGDRLTEFGWISLLRSEDKPVLYLNLKDPANRILRVSAEGVELEENGTNQQNVLLAESGQMQAFSYEPEVHVAQAMKDLRALVLDNMTCEPAQRYLVLAWALSAFMLPMAESRALMKMEGVSGSGKTTAAKLISLLLYGSNMVGRSSTASDYSMAATEPLIIKDNLETDDLNRNALNFLLLAATGATNIKRAQGTESGVVTEKINCLVAITAIEPFAKPELINRTLIIDFSKRWQRSDFVETEAVQRLTGRREDIVSAWLQIMAERVLPSLADRGEVIRYIKEQHRDFSKERVTEYVALLVLITRALLRFMPLPGDLKAEAGDRAPEYVLLDAWVRYQNEHSRAIEQGTNAVLALLEGLRRVFMIDFARKTVEPEKDDAGNTVTGGGDQVWCEVLGVHVRRARTVDDAGNEGRHWRYWFDSTTADVLSMMNRYGREFGVRVPFQNAKQLGVRMSNEGDTLRAAGWSRTLLRTLHGDRVCRWTWTDAEEKAVAPARNAATPQTAPKAQSFNDFGAPPANIG